MSLDKQRFDPALWLVVLIVVLVLGLGITLYFSVRTDQVSEVIRSGEDLSLLLVIEKDGRPLATEVLFYNTETRRAALFDIPADLGALIDSQGRVDRIDTLYIDGDWTSYHAEIEQLLDSPIAFQIFLDTQGVERIVDLVEGIETLIIDQGIGSDQDLIAEAREDEALDSDFLLLPSGEVTLDGSQFRAYFEHRYSYEDAEQHSDRLQSLLVDLISALSDHSSFLTHRQVSPFLRSNILHTNLANAGIERLLVELEFIDTANIITWQTNGNLREVEIDGTTKPLLFPYFEGQWLRETVRQLRENMRTGALAVRDNVLIRLEILNGTSTIGLAQRTRDLYERYGFNVVFIDNAERDDIAHTTIIDRGVGEDTARRVADVIRADRIEFDLQETDEIDITIVLGNDFDGIYVRK